MDNAYAICNASLNEEETVAVSPGLSAQAVSTKKARETSDKMHADLMKRSEMTEAVRKWLNS